jgi:formylglycine-generating enzyme required for sulfatase activity
MPEPTAKAPPNPDTGRTPDPPPETKTTVPPEPKIELPAKTPEGPRPVELTNSIGMKLSGIPAGEFVRGDRTVRITRPFHMGIFEVTQGQFARVNGGNPSEFRSGDDFPADSVTWHAATEFCRKLSALPQEKAARRLYRLPTEAEWEHACRAGTTTDYAFGKTLTARQANFGRNVRRTMRVGSFPPNGWGLHDMHGNVSEWCADWYAEGYYTTAPVADPPGPSSSPDNERVLRGGNWEDGGSECASGHREKDPPGTRESKLGFRVVCVPPGAEFERPLFHR